MILLVFFAAHAFAQLSPVDSTISGTITASNVILSASKKYLLSGFVYVDSLAKITIPAGTVIYGDKATKAALIIKRGGKIDAQGTLNNPIVFTSQQAVGTRAAGDWGGIIICGAASNNQSVHQQIEGSVNAYHGGTIDDDSSGVMRYVRIEYPGISFTPNNEINGLTMGSVGSRTVIDYIQVSYSGDDAFEWFGGTVNHKYLIAYKTWDDDFDTDFGYRGKVQFGLAIREPQLADVSSSEAFESDNDGSGTFKTPRTAPIFSNITAIGPKQTSSDASGTYHPKHYYGIHHRRNTLHSVRNSVLAGFVNGALYLDGSSTGTQAGADSFLYRNNKVAGMLKCATNATGFNVFAWFNTVSYGNDSVGEPSVLNLRNPYNRINPDCRPNAGSPVLGASNFSGMTDPFWTPVHYVGAFDDDSSRWDIGWTNYDPQNTFYSSSAISWSNSLRITNSGNESQYVIYGRASGATDGVDASLGETAAPPFFSDNIDIRCVLPGGTETFLDLRNTGVVSGDKIVYKFLFNPGTTYTGTGYLRWDPNLLGAGNFYISDSLGGAIFPLTNMKTSASVSFDGSLGQLEAYIYCYPSFSISLPAIADKWNLVSFPGQHVNSMLADTLYKGKHSGNVFTFNGTSYVGSSTMTNGKGYWMKHNGARAYNWNGTVQSGVLYPKLQYVKRSPITLTAGWNLIGGYESTIAVSALTTAPGNSISGTVWGYSTGYVSAANIEPGLGYWLFSNNAGFLYYPGPYSGIAKAEVNPLTEAIQNNWMKIIFTDAAGHRYVLYGSENDIDNPVFMLPPAPPAEVFDIRFNTNKIVENLSSMKGIDLSGVVYPIMLRVENGNINVSADGINASLSNGQELRISNANISSLLVSANAEIPAAYDLVQNFPNPFNPTTTIKFALPEAANVKVTIFNSLGQKVQELVKGNFDAGTHNVTWNATGFTSGIYFYELRTEKFVSVKKMMLVK